MISTAKDLVDMGTELHAPAKILLTYIESLLECTNNEHALQEYIPDIRKMLTSGQQLLGLIKKISSHEYIESAQKKTGFEPFTATIRHDLRTPINAILGYGEMLLEDTETTITPAAAQELNRVIESTREILTSINDLMYFQKAVDSSQTHVSSDQATKNEEILLSLAHSPSKWMTDAISKIGNENVTIVSNVESKGLILVVDDGANNRELVSRRLVNKGFTVDEAESGQIALEMVMAKNYDLILLDVMMPGLNGYQVLDELKRNPKWRHIPVLMVSALDEIDGVVQCIKMGAEDYLHKPINHILLLTKITACLDRKRLRDGEQAYLAKLQIEQKKSEALLLNILPKPIADRLKRGESVIADSFPEATVLFSDLVGFTQLSAGVPASQLVEQLNEIFLAFDILTESHGLEKIKTIGDAYMLVGGLPTPRLDHAEAVADIAIEMLSAIEKINKENQLNLKIRIGIHTGSVVAGVIGKKKFNYDLWGDAVNIASRMESHSIPGKIQLSEATYRLIQDKFDCECRGLIDIKGKGQMKTYFLQGRKKT